MNITKFMVDNKIAGVMCGKIVTYVKSVDLMIEDFYVDPEYQRMGIGHKMMILLEKEPKNRKMIPL